MMLPAPPFPRKGQDRGRKHHAVVRRPHEGLRGYKPRYRLPMGRSAQVVAFSTSASMAQDIDRVAAEHGVSRSALIRSAIEQYLAARPNDAHAVREPAAEYAAAVDGKRVPPLHGLHQVLLGRKALGEICRRHGVHRLWLFGSAVRDDFVLGSSDYDFQVEFDVGPWARHLFELAGALEVLLGAQVDVGQALPITNPHLRETTEGERVLAYESS